MDLKERDALVARARRAQAEAVTALTAAAANVLWRQWLKLKDRRSAGRRVSTVAEANNRYVQRFLRWRRPRSAQEQYLSAATDLADLERRIRVVERASEGPLFVTFNH
jgi:hypothetical protein